RTEQLHPPPREVVLAGAGGDHLDRAARQAERGGPHGLLAGPPDGAIERRRQDAATDLPLDLLRRPAGLDALEPLNGHGRPPRAPALAQRCLPSRSARPPP